MNSLIVVNAEYTWARVPRTGSRFNFGLDCNTIAGVISTRWPPEYMPIEFLAVQAEFQPNGSCVSSVMRFGIADFCKIAEHHLVYIYSKKITSPYPFETLEYPAASWNLSGFICVQFNVFKNDRSLKPSSIACTDKIFNPATGETVSHTEYRKAYVSLVKGLRKAE